MALHYLNQLVRSRLSTKEEDLHVLPVAMWLTARPLNVAVLVVRLTQNICAGLSVSYFSWAIFHQPCFRKGLLLTECLYCRKGTFNLLGQSVYGPPDVEPGRGLIPLA